MRKRTLLFMLVFSLVCICKSQKMGTNLKNITEADKFKPKKKPDNPIKKDIKKYLKECGANVSDEDSDEGNNNDNKNDGDEEDEEGDMKQQKTLSGMKSRTGSYPNNYGAGGGKNKGTYPTSYGSGARDDDDCDEEDSQEKRGRRKNSKNNRRNKRSRNEQKINNVNFVIDPNHKLYKNLQIKFEEMKHFESEIDKNKIFHESNNQKYKNQDLFKNAINEFKQSIRFLNRKDRLYENYKSIKLKNYDKLKTRKAELMLLPEADRSGETELKNKVIHKRSNEEETKDVETFKVEDEDDFERYKNRNDKRRGGGGGKRKKNDDYDEDSDEEDDDDGCDDSDKNRRGGNRNNNRGKNNRNKNNRGNKRGGYNSFGGSGEDRYGGGNPYGTRYGGGYGAGYGGEFGLYDGWGMYGGRLVRMMNTTDLEKRRKKRDIEYDDAKDPNDVQCLSQCVMGYLEMLDDNRVPSETEVIKYLQYKISDSSSRIKTIREARRCFARLATTDTENGCQFSKSLALCMKLEIEKI